MKQNVLCLLVIAAVVIGVVHQARGLREGYEGRARACGCDPWSEHCVVPPHSAPSYGCITSFDSTAGKCAGAPTPNDAHWLQWGFGHGHPLTAGHSEEESVKIAKAVFGSDSANTMLLRDASIHRDSEEERPGPPNVDHEGVHDLVFHKHKPVFQTQCGQSTVPPSVAQKRTEKAVFADPVTTYTDLPVHLPTQHTLNPRQDTSAGRCVPSVTGIFQVCGPRAAGT